MEAAAASVLNHPNFQAAKIYYMMSCKQECLQSNQEFEYGPEFLDKCFELCAKKHNRFLKAHDHEEKELPELLDSCSKKGTQEEADKCKARVLIQSFEYLKEEVRLLKPDYYNE